MATILDAAASNDIDFLRQYDGDITYTRFCKNALMIAVDHGHVEFVREILRMIEDHDDPKHSLLDLIAQTNKRGKNVFAMADLTGEACDECVQVLLEALEFYGIGN